MEMSTSRTSNIGLDRGVMGGSELVWSRNEAVDSNELTVILHCLHAVKI